MRQKRLENGPRRAKRILIGLLDQLPLPVVEEISPSSSLLRRNLKVPLVFYGISSGILNGLSIVLTKSGNEIIANSFYESDFSDLLIAFTFNFVAIFTSSSNIYVLNKSMEAYNHLDVMPIYQSMILLLMLTTGLLVFNEQQLYTWFEIIRLFGSAMVVIVGIWILTCKHNALVIHNEK